MFITAIVAVDKNYAIGHNGDLAIKNSADMQHFKETTNGHVVVMGYNTAKSLKKPLPNRTNYVMLDADYKDVQQLDIHPDFSVVFVRDDLVWSTLKHIEDDHPDQQVFIIGGAWLYKKCAPYCSRLLLTQLHDGNPNANVFFPKEAFSGYNIVGGRVLNNMATLLDYVNPDCIYG